MRSAKDRRDKYWTEVDEDDIRKYLYINMMFGILSLPEMRMYWSKDPTYRQSGVADIMGRQRFKKIHQYFHINRNPQPEPTEEVPHDPLYKVRPALDLVRNACANSYYPLKDLAVDEAMIGYNGRLSFKQYMPNKPDSYGIKVGCLAESTSGYIQNFQVYTGKANNPNNDEVGQGYQVVWSLSQPYLNFGH